MNRRIVNVSLVAVLASGMGLGCGTTGDRKPYLQDPLLISKKPVLGRAQDAQPVLLAQADPIPPMGPGVSLAAAPRPVEPANPPTAVAEDLRSLTQPGSPGSGGPAQTVSTYKGAVEVSPAVRVKDGQPVSAVTAVQRRVPGIYGNAPDYGWLQGVADKHYQGHWYLRFCDPGVEDKYGGKVCLLDDPRLAQLKDGDVVFVEGEIVQDKETVNRGPWHHYPRYQIRTLKPVQPQE
jgi:hypothetical protein